MNSRGFALTELIVVLVIIGVLLGLGTLNFSGWQVKYNVQKQTREMLSDLNNARLTAIQQKKTVKVALQPKSYTFKNYTSDGDASGTQFFSKQLPYQIQDSSGSQFSDTPIVFDIRGLMTSPTSDQTIMLLPTGTSSSYDCLVISVGRINIGAMSGGKCNAK